MDRTLVYFDKAERERIRRVLLRYMQDNRIGTPKLRDLIAEANGLVARRDGKEPIALSTVQRFVSNTHRANDSFVGLCARFAADLPDADPVAVFGEQLTAFLDANDPGKEGGNAPQALPPVMAGAFACHARRDLPASGQMRLLPKGDDRDLIPYSRLEITPMPGQPFATVHERVRHRTPPADPLLGPATVPCRAYEGVATGTGGAVLALMRDMLLGTPRLYWLGRAADGGLAGEGSESPSRFADNQGGPTLPTSVRIVLAPEPEDEDE